MEGPFSRRHRIHCHTDTDRGDCTSDPTVPAGKPNKPIAPRPGALPPPNPPDPAHGKISFRVSRGGGEIDVVGKLSQISNVSAVTLHDLKYPGYSYTDTAVTPPTLTIANYTNQIGTTVAVLLSPGNASGSIGGGVFQTVIKPQYLVGPLAGEPLHVLLDDIRSGLVYVNVQTNDGVDSAPTQRPQAIFRSARFEGWLEASDLAQPPFRHPETLTSHDNGGRLTQLVASAGDGPCSSKLNEA